MNLLLFMAEACHYAQEHIDGWDSGDDFDREVALECTSYQMSCFIAQNTVNGKNGVESDILIAELVETPTKSIAEWTDIILEISFDLGGFKEGVL